MSNKELNQIDETIKNIKKKNDNLISNTSFEKEEILLKDMLDKEVEKINNKIINSKPKWILENFDEFLCKRFEKNRNEEVIEVIEVKILKRKDAIKLGDTLKKLRGHNTNNTKKIKIIWEDGFNYWAYKAYFDENKVMELLKGWVFYYNTKVKYKKIKFNQIGYDKFTLFLAMVGLYLCYAAAAIMVITGIILAVVFIIKLI